MRSRQTELSPVHRCFAAASLLVWLAAQVVCTAHCNFGVCHGESEDASCHDAAPPQSHHDDGDSPSPAHGDSSTTDACLTLKSALVSGSGPALVPPDLHLLYTLAPVALTLDMSATKPAVSFSRQAKPPDWGFTPEVYLGPAHRSHAPPFLS